MFASFWFWPMSFILLAIYLSVSVPELARYLPAVELKPLQDIAAGAQVYAVAILTTTAGADITILTFVFSTLMVVLQLASSQLSPRILRPTLREGRVQLVMGVMAGGFVFSVSSLLGVYGERQPHVVAGPVLVAITWTFLIVLTFLYFVGYTVSRIRAPAVIRAIAAETGRSIRQLYGQRASVEGAAMPNLDVVMELKSPADGIVTGLALRDTSRWAERWNAEVELDVGLGEYVSEGMTVGRVRAGDEPRNANAVLRFIVIERERTLRGDPPYGFRLLVDIASRSLSPAINDPTTAVQVIDELQSLLVLLGNRPEEPGRVYDRDGILRVKVPTMSWNAYLGLAVQEIYEFGRESSQVTQRLASMLEELARVVPDTRADVVRELRAKIEVVSPLVAPSKGEQY